MSEGERSSAERTRVLRALEARDSWPAPAEHIQKLVDTMRQHPETSWVCYRINNGDWESAKGREFLELWDQPFAGTISIDYVTFGEPQ